MTKFCPLTRTQYGNGRRCFEKECVLYDVKENVCLIKKALESCTTNSSLGDIIKQKIGK